MYLFSFDYPPRPGGIARLCSELARALAERGALEATLTAEPGWSGRPAGLQELRFAQRRGVQELQAAHFLRKSQPANVLCGRWWPEAALVVGSARSAPTVLAHGTELLSGSRAGDRVRSLLRRRVLERAHLVVANSRFTSELVQRAAPSARCAVLTPAVDHVRFSPGDQVAARKRLELPLDLRIVSTVSRIQKHKGHATILRAMASLPVADQKQLLYLIVGSGPALSELRSLARELALESQIRWLGHVPEGFLPDVYRASDLHLLASERISGAVEGFGMVSLEAQSCGVAALGANSGGIADALVLGEGGFIVEPGDPSAVASHLSQLLANPDFYRTAGAAGRLRVLRECTWSHYVDALLHQVASVTPS